MKFTLVLLLFVVTISSCKQKIKIEQHPEFATIFDEYKVQGCFLLYDFQEEKTLIYNKDRCETGFLPASTFKMVNTLIGLETGIITGEEFVIPWDSVNRQIPAWNCEHNLASAFQYSVVPWYQGLARQIGVQKMITGVAKARFGKMNVRKDNIDLFWLVGESRITPFEQLDFQKRLVRNEVPFKQKHIDLLKKIMQFDETPEYIFRGKTGWAVMDNINIGWMVGYVEIDSRTYAYVLNVESGDEDTRLFRNSRTEIPFKIFKQLSLVK